MEALPEGLLRCSSQYTAAATDVCLICLVCGAIVQFTFLAPVT